MRDVFITPASGTIEFKSGSALVESFISASGTELILSASRFRFLGDFEMTGSDTYFDNRIPSNSLFVSPSFTGLSAPYYTNISDAITAANVSQSIYLYPARYTENATINKSVSIVALDPAHTYLNGYVNIQSVSNDIRAYVRCDVRDYYVDQGPGHGIVHIIQEGNVYGGTGIYFDHGAKNNATLNVYGNVDGYNPVVIARTVVNIYGNVTSRGSAALASTSGLLAVYGNVSGAVPQDSFQDFIQPDGGSIRVFGNISGYAPLEDGNEFINIHTTGEIYIEGNILCKNPSGSEASGSFLLIDTGNGKATFNGDITLENVQGINLIGNDGVCKIVNSTISSSFLTENKLFLEVTTGSVEIYNTHFKLADVDKYVLAKVDETVYVSGSVSASAFYMNDLIVNQSGSINHLDVTENIIGGTFYGDGSGLTNISASGLINIEKSASIWQSSSVGIFTNNTNSNVGIGTIIPREQLHVWNNISASVIYGSSISASNGGYFGAGGITVDGDSTINGILFAQEFHTNFVSSSIIYSSGSTKFGDTGDDIHQFTGSIRQSGSDSYFMNNVGIGKTSPTVALDVVGSTILGNTSAHVHRVTGSIFHLTNIGGIGEIRAQGSTHATLRVKRASNSYGASVNFDTAPSTNDWLMGLRASDSDFHLYSYGIADDVLKIGRTTGDFGIGISSNTPQMRFHIANGFASGSGIYPYSAGSWPGADVMLVENSSTQNTSIQILSSVDRDGLLLFSEPANRATGYIRYSQGDDIMSFAASTTEHMFLLGTGELGIGTSTPTAELDVSGDVSISGSTLTLHQVGGTPYVQLDTNGSDSRILFARQSTGGPGAHIDSNNYLIYYSGGGGSYHAWDVSGTEIMRIPFSKNVGIGTTAPAAQLEVQAVPGHDGLLNVGDILYVSSSTTAVGVNVQNPETKLHVYGSGSTVMKVEGSLGTLFQVNDTLSGSLFGVSDISGMPILEVFDDDRVVAGRFGSNTLVVTGSEVGIGTNTPQAKLHVSGTISGSNLDINTEDGDIVTLGSKGISTIRMWSDTDVTGNADGYIQIGHGNDGSGSPDESWAFGMSADDNTFYVSYLETDWTDITDNHTMALSGSGDVTFTGFVSGSGVRAGNMKQGTLTAPPTGLFIGEMWEDTGSSSDHPLIRIAKVAT